MDRFAALTAFVTVAELKGFAPAARKLGLPPSAVTRLVAGLESHLGVRLFNRTTRQVALTDPGGRFLARAHKILSDLDEAERAAENERGQPIGRLVVSAPLVFGRLHVGPELCAFLNNNPAVQGELFLNDRRVNLVEEGIDIAIRIGTLDDSADVARLMGATRRLLVASPTYVARRGAPKTPEDLAQHRTIAFSAITQPKTWRFKAGTIDVQPAYVTNSADAALWHAVRHGGVTFALSYQADEALRAGELVVLLPEHEPEPMPIHVVYPSSRLLSLKVRAFIDHLASRVDWRFLEVPRKA